MPDKPKKVKIVWSAKKTDFFAEAAKLTPHQRDLLETRIAGMTRKEQADYFNISDRTLYRELETLFEKYDLVQQEYPDIFKPRFVSEQEKYLDEN